MTEAPSVEELCTSWAIGEIADMLRLGRMKTREDREFMLDAVGRLGIDAYHDATYLNGEWEAAGEIVHKYGWEHAVLTIADRFGGRAEMEELIK